MRFIRRLLAPALTGVMVAGLGDRGSAAEVIHVPADYATISEAVQSTSSGDVVRIAAGRYAESVDVGGRAITIESEIEGAAAIVAPEGERGLLLDSGEGAGTVIRGIVFEATGESGGGILLDGAPVIENCVFVGCRNSTGGGILSTGGSPTIRECGFKGCVALGAPVTYGGGGGVRLIGGSSLIQDCRFVGCISHQGNAGGLMKEGGGSVEVLRTTFVACSADDRWGAAIYNVSSQVVARDCLFDSMSGMVLHGWSPYTLERCLFRNIVSDGDCVEVKSGTTHVVDCVFERCEAESAVLGSYSSGVYAMSGTTFCECTELIFEGGWADLGGNDFDATCGCPTDLTGDGWTRAGDLGLVIGGWGPCDPGSVGDLDGSGEVNNADLAMLLAGWGPCP